MTAQISFTPPDVYKIIQASGNQRGEKIVRTILDQEIGAAMKSDNNQISRGNYDFAFLRRENFGVIPEYVLLIFPKRKAKNLLLGQIWVDANTFRIRRIEGVPIKSPSIWIKDIHVTSKPNARRGRSRSRFGEVPSLPLFQLSGCRLRPVDEKIQAGP